MKETIDTQTTDDKLYISISKAVLLVATPFTILLQGAAICYNFNWYFSPLVGGLKISIPQAIGIDLLFTQIFSFYRCYFSYSFSKGEDRKTKEFWQKRIALIDYSLVSAGVALVLGWILHFFL